MNAYLGLDFGTSGARAVIIDGEGAVLHEARRAFAEQTPEVWRAALFDLLGTVPGELRRSLRAIAIDGTSSTVLLCDAAGEPLLPPLLYNDNRATREAKELEAVAPPGHAVLGASSSLAKLLWLAKQAEFGRPRWLMHQADWLGFMLHGRPGISDYHNALKLGCDPATVGWPDWLLRLPVAPLLPHVVEPGTAIGAITPEIARDFGLPPDCVVRAGTTDSIAAFIAAGANKPGEAVTSLGSSIVLKLLSETRVDASTYGIYSHRFGNLWLAGGASNSGGAVLAHYFSRAQLEALSRRIDPAAPSELDYYPLLKPGERFPVNDPALPPRLSPRPPDDAVFLHGLLEGMARIEAQGYCLLKKLGATPLQSVLTAGGGARNPAWTAIRARALGVPVRPAAHIEAAYGSALLAKAGTGPLYCGKRKTQPQ